jgi:hypothetical protein
MRMETEMKKKPRRLTDISLTEVSLVTSPANPGAQVLLFKRARPDAEIYASVEKGIRELEGQINGAKAILNRSAHVAPETEHRIEKEKSMDEITKAVSYVKAGAHKGLTEDYFCDRLEELAKREQTAGESYSAAYMRVLGSDEGQLLYRGALEGNKATPAIRKREEVPLTKAEGQLERIAEEIAKSESINMYAARVRAYERNPLLYEQLAAEEGRRSSMTPAA